MREIAFLASGLVIGLLVGGALLLDQMVQHQDEVRALRKLIPPARRPLGHYSGANSPHPLQHETWYVEVPDDVGEAWRALEAAS